MRRLILSALMLVASATLFAQNYDDITKNLRDGKLDEAKARIDKIAAEPKYQGKAETWFYKAKVYNALATKTPDSVLLEDALASMLKYFNIENMNKDVKKRYLHSMLENHSTAFDIRANFVSQGVKAYQASKWRSAYYNFARSLDAFDYLVKSELTNSKLDTNLVLYTGAAAQAAKMDEEAAKYYTVIADLKMKEETNVAVYDFLIGYYARKKDMANRDKYLEMAKAIFPGKDIWMNYEIGELSEDTKERLKQYEALVAKFPDNYNINLAYVGDLFNYTYAEGNSTKALKDKLTAAIQNVIRINSSTIANYIMTQHISNEIYDIETAIATIKGTGAPEVARKKALTEERAAKFETMLPYALKAYEMYTAMEELKTEDRVNLGKTLDNLIDYYQFKKMPDKVTFYQTKKKGQ